MVPNPLHAWHPGDVGRRDVGFGAFCLLSLVLLVPVQLATIVVFDSVAMVSGVPTSLFVGVVPAMVVTLLVALAASRLYSLRVALAVGSGLFVVSAVAATYVASLPHSYAAG